MHEKSTLSFPGQQLVQNLRELCEEFPPFEVPSDDSDSNIKNINNDEKENNGHQ